MIAAAQKAAQTFTAFWVFNRDDLLVFSAYTQAECSAWIKDEGEHRLYDVCKCTSRDGERTVSRPVLTLKGPKR